jgi:hypothetical protein
MAIGSVSPFRPSGTAVVSAGGVSVNTLLTAGGDTVVVTNATGAIIFIKFGSDSLVTASTADFPVLANSAMIFSVNPLVTYAAAIAPSASGNVYFSRGDGSII